MLGRIHSAQYYLMTEAEYVNSLSEAVIGPMCIFIGAFSLAEMSFIEFNWISCIFGCLFIAFGFWITYRNRVKALSNNRVVPLLY